MSSKHNALERALEANSIGDFDAVHAALDTYVRAPRLTLNLNKKYGHITPRSSLERLAAQGYPQLQRWFHRVPKKRNLVRREGPLNTWTQHTYRGIQHVRRGPTMSYYPMPEQRARAQRNSAWLQTFMTRHALRAPATPAGAPRGPLYRGMRITDRELLGMVKERKWSDRGFMSFTRDKQHAVKFGSRQTGRRTTYMVLFKMRLGDVAAGTPWIWFVGDKELETFPVYKSDFWDTREWQAHGVTEESEVTMPPGTLRIKYMNDESTVSDVDFVAEVAFTPAPEFAWKPRRKGTRESNDNILWNIFANEPVTRKRARSPSSSPQPSRKARVCTARRSCAIM